MTTDWTPVSEVPLPTSTVVQCRFSDGTVYRHCVLYDDLFSVMNTDRPVSDAGRVTHWRPWQPSRPAPDTEEATTPGR